MPLLETSGQVRWASEAAVEGDLGHGLVPGEQQLLRALQAGFHRRGGVERKDRFSPATLTLPDLFP